MYVFRDVESQILTDRVFPRERSALLRSVCAIVLLTLCLALGGSSREDVAGLLILYPGVILIATIVLVSPGSFRWADFRTMTMVLSVIGFWMIVQLIPVPPAIWIQLPLRSEIAQGAELAGVPSVWRPISVVPDMTLASLAHLAIAIAVVVSLASMPRAAEQHYGPVLIGVGLLSALFGAAQVAGGPDSVFYLYNRGIDIDTTGLFSNRNHHALLLTMMFPLTAAIVETKLANRLGSGGRVLVTIAGSLFWLAMLLVAGSRAGLLMGLVAFALSLALITKPFGHATIGGKRMRREALWAATLLATILVFAVFRSSWSTLDRIVGVDPANEMRFRSLQVLFDMSTQFWLFGAGFGTFDPAYRFFEPDALLAETYLNHAHNDVLELIITGGLLPTLAVFALVFHTARRSLALLRNGSNSVEAIYGRVASIFLLLIGIASLVDYPLRTPLITAILIVAYGWLASASRGLPKKTLR